MLFEATVGRCSGFGSGMRRGSSLSSVSSCMLVDVLAGLCDVLSVPYVSSSSIFSRQFLHAFVQKKMAIPRPKTMNNPQSM